MPRHPNDPMHPRYSASTMSFAEYNCQIQEAVRNRQEQYRRNQEHYEEPTSPPPGASDAIDRMLCDAEALRRQQMCELYEYRPVNSVTLNNNVGIMSLEDFHREHASNIHIDYVRRPRATTVSVEPPNQQPSESQDTMPFTTPPCFLGITHPSIRAGAEPNTNEYFESVRHDFTRHHVPSIGNHLYRSYPLSRRRELLTLSTEVLDRAYAESNSLIAGTASNSMDTPPGMPPLSALPARIQRIVSKLRCHQFNVELVDVLAEITGFNFMSYLNIRDGRYIDCDTDEAPYLPDWGMYEITRCTNDNNYPTDTPILHFNDASYGVFFGADGALHSGNDLQNIRQHTCRAVSPEKFAHFKAAIVAFIAAARSPEGRVLWMA